MRLLATAAAAVFLAVLTSIPHTTAQSAGIFVNIWLSSATCSGAPSASQIVANGQCVNVSPGSASVACMSTSANSGWIAGLHIGSGCQGPAIASPAGTGTVCVPVSVEGVTGSVIIDCSGASATATTAPATTAPVTTYPLEHVVPYAALPLGYVAEFYLRGMSAPRQTAYDSVNDVLLVLNKGNSTVFALKDVSGDGHIDPAIPGESTQIINLSGLNHGIAFYNNTIYASTSSAVYSWPYTGPATNFTDTIQAAARTVVANVPASADHGTRTLAVSPNGQYLIVTVGSPDNVASAVSNTAALIIRYNISALTSAPPAGVDYSTGQIVATGLRNEVAIGYDAAGNLWGAQNGNDQLYREDLGGDIHVNNPAERVDVFPESTIGSFRGYPLCWTEWQLAANITDSAYLQQWAMPAGANDGSYPPYGGVPPMGTIQNATDEYCRNTSVVTPPVFALPPHTAPLGLAFYPNYTGSSNATYVFPNSTGTMFVASHGSWDRPVPIGYRVFALQFPAGANSVSGQQIQYPASYTSFFGYASPNTDSDGDQWPYRPVDVRMGNKGQMYVTSDTTNDVIVIRYIGGVFNQTANLTASSNSIFEQGAITFAANNSGIGLPEFNSGAATLPPSSGR